MRLCLALACLILVGCAGPHSTGALWAQQNLDHELVIGRQPAAERIAHLHADELALADESLGAERARLGQVAQDCPGTTRQTLELSPGDRVRDAIRLRVGDDQPRQAAIAQLALADWRLRRAAATGEAHFCDEARQALAAPTASDGRSSDAAPTSSGDQLPTTDLLAGLGSATVTRDPGSAGVMTDQTASPGPSEMAAVSLALSDYALGYVDSVRARAPLPQYLAAVYGGTLIDVDSPPRLDIWLPEFSASAGTPEGMVDRLAPVLPQWEPDAIYAALRPV